MDRATKNLYARVAGALALSAFFIHVGQHLSTTYPERVPPLAWATVALFLALGVAAAWAQARLNAKRPALWTALATTGLLPAAAALYHRAPLAAGGGYGIILLLALLLGATTTALCATLLAHHPTPE